MKTLIKLQAFIDHALGVSAMKFYVPEYDRLEDVEKEISLWHPGLDQKSLIACFLRMAIDDTQEYRRIAASLRSTEAYSMVSFLLREGGGKKLGLLSARYGVSAGHFRRIFRDALGDSPKSALNDWRLAAAILAVIDRRESVTEVAMEYGFSSSSHFSREVKKSLGISLTHLLDKERKRRG